jgi:hypothetical protein
MFKSLKNLGKPKMQLGQLNPKMFTKKLSDFKKNPKMLMEKLRQLF